MYGSAVESQPEPCSVYPKVGDVQFRDDFTIANKRLNDHVLQAPPLDFKRRTVDLHCHDRGLTFDMSGMTRLAGACPLDGGVRPHDGRDEAQSNFHDSRYEGPDGV